MSAFYRSESGRPGRLAPFFPQRINKTRSSQGIGGDYFTLPRPWPASASSAHLLIQLITRLSIKSASSSLLASFFTSLGDDPPSWAHVFQAQAARDFSWLPNHPPTDTMSHLHVLFVLSGLFHLPTSFPPNRQIPPFFLPLRL